MNNGIKSFFNVDILPDEDGFFGEYGGMFLSDDLKIECEKIKNTFLECKADPGFNNEFRYLLKNYAGRPTPVYFAKNLSEKYGSEIFLKREDLNHTGAHKINHALGEALLAKKLGKKKLIAETGAGQHGVAVSAAAVLMGLKCDIYMGEDDARKERLNVDRMRMLGTNVIIVHNNNEKEHKKAVDVAFNAYLDEYNDALYASGSVTGPHPFPMIVEYFQSVIGAEAREQFFEQTAALPDAVIACIGGGSNAIGVFDGFMNDKSVKLYGVEPFGKGENENAASITYGKIGIIRGFRCLLLQDEDGKVKEAHSVASGLHSPEIGPKHCYLHDIGRVNYVTIGDQEAIDAFFELSRSEGIIPALESAHAVAYALKYATINPHSKILVNISGRGDKDIEFVLKSKNLIS